MTANNTEIAIPPDLAIKRRKFPLVLIPLLAMVSCGTLNYAGFCFEEGWFLSDDAVIKKAIENSWENGLNYDRNGREIPILEPAELKGIKYVVGRPYTDITDFHEKNPNCCRMTHTDVPREFFDFSAPYQPLWRGVLFGQGRGYVLINENSPYIDKEGRRKTLKTTHVWSVDNCGGDAPDYDGFD